MKKQSVDYCKELQDSFDRWEYIFQHGASDPFWEDGCNLNLERNHIFYFKKMIEENPTLLGFPEIYYKDVSPEVDQTYMARPDEIRKAAKAALVKYKADKNYRYVREHYNDFSTKTRNQLFIDNIIGYATGLESYIQDENLVAMRRHEHSERYLQSFEECAHKMQATPSEPTQLSLFSLSCDCLAEPDENEFDEDIFEEFDEPYNDDGMEM